MTDRAGTPLSRALVVMTSDAGKSLEVATDDDGRFALTLDRTTLEYTGEVTRDGFEPVRFSLDYVALRAADLAMAFRLYAIVRVEAGRSIELSVSSDDEFCDYKISHVDRGPCRRVRVFSPIGGRLSLSARVSAADEAAGHGVMVQLPDPPFGTWAPLEVGAGRETVVEIIKIGAGDTTRFTLHTTLAP